MVRPLSLIARLRAHTTNLLRALSALLLASLVGVAVVACASASGASTPATPSGVPVSVSATAVGPAVSAGFVGIATEYWNVEKEVGTDPAKPDVAFEQTARNLAPYGNLNLRIGGDSTDWTWFPIPGMAQPPWVRWTMTPTWAAVTKRLVNDLHAHLIVGINMEAGSLKVDDAEIQEIDKGVGGSAPITFELGNEPELYSHFPFYHDAAGGAVLGRPKTYSLQTMASQWNDIAKALPRVRLAGPGYSSLTALPYVSQFLSSTKRLSLLTVHTYPLKSKRCTGGASREESELFDGSSLQGLATRVSSWTALARQYLVGVRVDEMNSVTCGGEPGLTNSFGPALWALNILPLYAQEGVSGVNFQTRPFTAQNLIQTDDTHAGWRVVVQPEYYGLLAFAKLTPPGSRILSVSVLKNGLLAWAVRTPQGVTHVVVTNVGSSATDVAIKAAGASGNATAEALRSSSGKLSASTGVSLGGQSISASTGQLSGTPVIRTVHRTAGAYELSVPAASAEILSFRGYPRRSATSAALGRPSP